MKAFDKVTKNVDENIMELDKATKNLMPDDFDEQNYEIAMQALLMTFEQVGNGMPEPTRKAWNKVFNYLTMMAKRAYQQREKYY